LKKAYLSEEDTLYWIFMYRDNEQKWRPLAHVQIPLHLLLGWEVVRDLDFMYSVSPTSFIIIATRHP